MGRDTLRSQVGNSGSLVAFPPKDRMPRPAAEGAHGKRPAKVDDIHCATLAKFYSCRVEDRVRRMNALSLKSTSLSQKAFEFRSILRGYAD